MKSQVDGFGKSIGSWGSKLSGANGLGALIGFTGVTAPAVAGIKAITSAASDLNESMSAATITYGDGAQDILKYSRESAQAVGLSQQEYLQGATVLGVYGTNAGLTGKALANFGNDTIGAAADLASFYNAPVPEALAAIQAGLRGEADPLERFGIMMNDAAVQAYAMEKGIWDGSGAMTDQQKVLARQGFIMDHLGAASGDFARTSDGLANSQRILGAEFKDLQAQLGMFLLPYMLQLSSYAKQAMQFLMGLNPEVKKFAAFLLVAVAAAGPLMMVLGPVISLLGLLLSPIGLVIAALALLAYAYKTNLGGFADAVDSVAKKAAKFGKSFKKWFDFYDQMSGVGKIEAIFKSLALAIIELFGATDKAKGIYQFFSVLATGVERPIAAIKKIASAFIDLAKALMAGDWSGALGNFRKMLAGIGDLLASPAKLVGQLLQSITTGFEPLDNVLQNLGKVWVDFGRLLQEIFQGDISGALEVGQRLFRHFIEYLMSLGSLIATAIAAIASAINWGAVIDALVGGLSSLAGMLGDVASYLLPIGIDLLVGVMNGISQYLPIVASLLGALGSFLLPYLSAAGTWLLQTGIDLLVGIMNGISQYLPIVAALLGALGAFILPYLASAGTWLLNTGIQLIVGILNGISQYLPVLGALLLGFASFVAPYFASAGTWLLNTGIQLLVGLINGISQYLPVLGSMLMGLATWVLPYFVSAGTWLLSTGIQLIVGLINGIVQYLPVLGAMLMGLATWVLPYFISAGTWLLNTGIQLIVGLITGLTSYLPVLGALLLALGTWAIGQVGDLAATLLPQGIQLIVGVVQGLTDYLPVLAALLTTLGIWALGQVGDVSKALLQRGVQLVAGIVTGWTNFLPTLASLARTIGSWVFNQIGSLATTLLQKGVQLVAGLITGWTNQLPALSAIVGGLGSFITNAASSAYQAAWDLGWNVGQGLIDGISGIWNSVTSYAQSLADAVIDIIKNPLKVFSPSRVMIWIGEMVGKGLVIGLANMIRPVGNAAGDLATAGTPMPQTEYNYTGGYYPGTGNTPASSYGNQATGTPPSVTIIVNGADDPTTVAQEVYRILSRELGLRGEGV